MTRPAAHRVGGDSRSRRITRAEYRRAWRDVRMQVINLSLKADANRAAYKALWQRDFPDVCGFVDVDFNEGPFSWKNIFVINRMVHCRWLHDMRRGRKLPR